MLRLLALAACCAVSAAESPVVVEPPPGWSDVTSEAGGGAVVVALKGPEKSSFLLTRVPRLALDNRGVVRAFLADVMAALGRRSGQEFTPSSPLVAVRYDNGLSLQLIKADLNGRPRLILGVTDFGGETLLATLVSSVPDTLLPSIMGGLRGPRAAQQGQGPASQALSLDGQLAFALPAELRSRDLSESEQKMGFVLAVQGLGGELMILKVLEDGGVAAKDQPGVVRQTVLSVAGVEPGSLSAVTLLETPAGPDMIYAHAEVQDASGQARFMAGYMPWAYWGYSVLSKGSQPVELAQRLFKGLSLGPSALPKLVASTRRIPVPRDLSIHWGRSQRLAAAGALGVLSAALILRGLALRRKKVDTE